MNKQKILEAIAGALDELDKEPEHLLLDLDARSVSNERIIAEVHLHNGELAFFHFYTRAYRDRQNQQRKDAAEISNDTYPLHT